MIEVVNYKKCTCDICGKVVNITENRNRPNSWERFEIGMKKYDVCLDCFIKVDMAIEDLKNGGK